MNQAEMLHFVEYELQIVALSWMAILYSIKAYQLSRLPMPWEKGQKRGNPNSGIRHSYSSIFMPWTRESSRTHLWRWLEFGFYHVAAFIAILDTFTLTFAPQFMTEPVRILFALLIAPAIPIGFVKLIKRIIIPELRVISTPDDYISLLSLQIFFFSAVMVLLVNSHFWRMSYFIVTAVFLFYVPFSKISHYIYYFFAHYLTGNRYGWRGVLPQERRAK